MKFHQQILQKLHFQLYPHTEPSDCRRPAWASHYILLLSSNCAQTASFIHIRNEDIQYHRLDGLGNHPHLKRNAAFHFALSSHYFGKRPDTFKYSQGVDKVMTWPL
uniref:Uncharacterized protein n=1 Tax=Parascaris equorum TaxID=6256 RepID=A0A914S4V2_PAREQ